MNHKARSKLNEQIKIIIALRFSKLLRNDPKHVTIFK